MVNFFMEAPHSYFFPIKTTTNNLLKFKHVSTEHHLVIISSIQIYSCANNFECVLERFTMPFKLQQGLMPTTRIK